MDDSLRVWSEGFLTHRVHEKLQTKLLTISCKIVITVSSKESRFEVFLLWIGFALKYKLSVHQYGQNNRGGDGLTFIVISAMQANRNASFIISSSNTDHKGIFKRIGKQTVLQESAAQWFSVEWSNLRISSTDSKLRTTLYSIINNTTAKHCSVAFI